MFTGNAVWMLAGTPMRAGAGDHAKPIERRCSCLRARGGGSRSRHEALTSPRRHWRGRCRPAGPLCHATYTIAAPQHNFYTDCRPLGVLNTILSCVCHDATVMTTLRSSLTVESAERELVGDLLLAPIVLLMAIALATFYRSGFVNVDLEWQLIWITVAGWLISRAIPIFSFQVAINALLQYVLIVFSATVLSYSAATVGRPLIDRELLLADQYIGYDWRAYAEFVANHPLIASAMKFSYTFIFFVPLIVTVASIATNNVRALEKFILAGLVSLSLTVGIFALFPATTAWTHLQLSDDRGCCISSFAAVFAGLDRKIDPNSPRGCCNLANAKWEWIDRFSEFSLFCSAPARVEHVDHTVVARTNDYHVPGVADSDADFRRTLHLRHDCRCSCHGDQRPGDRAALCADARFQKCSARFLAKSQFVFSVRPLRR